MKKCIKISRLIEKREEKTEKYCHEVAHTAIATLRKQGLNELQMRDLYETFSFKGSVVLWSAKKNKKEGKFLSKLKNKQMEDALTSALRSHLRQFYFGCDVISLTFEDTGTAFCAMFEMRRY